MSRYNIDIYEHRSSEQCQETNLKKVKNRRMSCVYICVSCWVEKILRQDNQSQISLDELLLELLPLEDEGDDVLVLFDSLVALEVNRYNYETLRLSYFLHNVNIQILKMYSFHVLHIYKNI